MSLTSDLIAVSQSSYKSPSPGLGVLIYSQIFAPRIETLPRFAIPSPTRTINSLCIFNRKRVYNWLTRAAMCHIVLFMETISIRDLHMHTGKWVRQVEKSTGQVVISDRGRPIARLMPLDEQKRRAFSDRILAEGFEDLPPVEVDSTHILEEDRR